MSDFLSGAALAIAAAGLAVSCATFVRNGRWKDTEAAQALLSRVDDCENRLTDAEATQRHAATKAELAEVKSELHGLTRQADRLEAGIARIESHLMSRA